MKNRSKKIVLAVISLAGFATTAVVHAAPVSYTYDDLNRLTSASYDGGLKIINYTYDAAGNMLSKVVLIDTDLDGYPDDEDAFPNDPNEWLDTDSDGLGNNSDNCPAVANVDQANQDGDSQGNACDDDDDNDGVLDEFDAFPLDPTEAIDSDGDGVGDNSDEFPLDPNEWVDSDGDSWGDNSDPFPLEPSIFFDVQPDHWAFPFIETLYGAGITAGCGNGNYCPSDSVK